VRRVYHLAADPNLWRNKRCEFDEVNHIGTLNVMRAALDNGASRVLYVSTESILTSDQFSGEAIEHARFREQDMIGPYCLSKFRAEQAVFQLAEHLQRVLLWHFVKERFRRILTVY
jgi:dihydroflavonol-4-reductase